MRIDPDTCRDADLLAAEVRRLQAAITALADQAAKPSVCDGRVTVTLDATLTDAERDAVSECYEWATVADHRSLAATLRGLLQRLGGER